MAGTAARPEPRRNQLAIKIQPQAWACARSWVPRPSTMNRLARWH